MAAFIYLFILHFFLWRTSVELFQAIFKIVLLIADIWPSETRHWCLLKIRLDEIGHAQLPARADKLKMEENRRQCPQ